MCLKYLSKGEFGVIIYRYEISIRDDDITYYAYEKKLFVRKEVGHITTRNIEDYIRLEDVFVEEDYRKQGIGRTLINKLVDLARKKTVCNFCLYILVRQTM